MAAPRFTSLACARWCACVCAGSVMSDPSCSSQSIEALFFLLVFLLIIPFTRLTRLMNVIPQLETLKSDLSALATFLIRLPRSVLPVPVRELSFPNSGGHRQSRDDKKTALSGSGGAARDFGTAQPTPQKDKYA